MTRTHSCGDSGGESFVIRYDLNEEIDIWAVCENCGRPTSIVEDGMEKQRLFENQKND